MSRASKLRRWARERANPEKMNMRNAGKDVGAGAALGLVSVPDGLAAGLLAGVSPVTGLYAYLVGTVAGAAATSSAFMTVQATGAMAVLIADVPQTTGEDGPAALLMLALLTGAILLTVGLLRLGSLVRFVPNAVLIGFVNAVAVNIVLGQLATFTGYASEAGHRMLRALDTVLHIGSFDWPTLIIGVATIALILAPEKTPLGPLGLFAAVVVTSGAVALFSLDSVTLLRDIADVPSSLPRLALPALSLAPALLVPAVSLAFVALIQGAAISKSVPNPDGTYPDVSGDIRGQGVANIAVGVLQGMPVGGSMSGTALVTEAGARSRLANVIAGVVMALVILLLGDVAGYIAMPALAGLLMLVGFRTFKWAELVLLWHTGATQITVVISTFVLTLLIPLQYAVLVGVAISVILHVTRQSNKVKVTRWVYGPDSPLPRETEPPTVLARGDVVVLNVCGSLFFASAPVFEAQLPKVVTDSEGSVVILRLRGKEDLGSTFIQVTTRYATTLESAGAHFMLAGVGDRVLRQLSQTGAIDTIGEENVFPVDPTVGASVADAMRRAQMLVVGRNDGGEKG